MKSTSLMQFRLVFIILFASIFVTAEEPHQRVEIDHGLLDDLRRNLIKSQESLLSEIPNDVKNELIKCKDRNDINKTPVHVQQWISDNVSNLTDIETAESFGNMAAYLREKGDYIHGDDVSVMLESAFLSKLNGKQYDLEKYIIETVIYWRENKTPDVKYSPLGLGEIKWIWKLDQPARIKGVVHVGIDKTKRVFICYEHGKGLFFPEGDILERIYAEIVQDPSMAGSHIGKRRKKE
jgi:hypothetical protein